MDTRAVINLLETINRIQGPFRIMEVDPSTRMVRLEDGRELSLDDSVKDMPKPDRSYALEIRDDTITNIVGMTVDNVVTTGDEVLLIRRKNQPYQGHWALPGGFIDPGETAEQAARRELREETNLDLGDTSLRFIGKFDTPYRDPRMENVWSFAFMVQIPKANVRAGDDATAAEWVPISKLPSLSMAFDHMDILRKAGVVR